ncbi:MULTISPECIES: hypothetical protein [Bacillus cereus group]|nr:MULTISPECIES: hypothetical protein [Bacillus cereus group]KAA0792445.1 hypothetical protein DN394_06105 [Bacillus sp. BB081]PEP73921.1 hypothetical protein CN573_15035 [Bacillus wiedmannii]PGB92947.1 hypothetical protein COM04_23005 [Bacillus wiedmannii]PGC27017.1 hypothetical protein COM23_03560 [Bacillus wiedmannii]PHB54232.1 hypothetical protein COE92_15670 [Bacillus wiedmannii]
MVQICPMYSKETCNSSDEGIDVNFCDECMTAAIDMEGEKQHKQTIIGMDWGSPNGSFSATVTIPYKRNLTK